jgi:signal transduction histidine kinase/DNA-binding response OmpR family regulator
MKFYPFIFIALSFHFFISNASLTPAQSNDLTGLPLIRNYLPSEHGGTPQNWAIVQDKRGIMYFANTGGLLEYDGSSWRLIKIENEVARTVAIDKRGTIFVGGVDQFGLLEPDLSGNLLYRSLLNYIPVEERNFGDVWSIWPVKDGVYFQSASHIFFINNAKIYSIDAKSYNTKLWKSKSVFSPAFLVDAKYFVPEVGTGLCTIDNDSIKLIKGGERFKDITIYAMLPRNNDITGNQQIFIGTENGFYIYDESSFWPFKTEADNYIIKNHLYFRGAILDDDTYAFGTQNGGLVIIDEHGKLLKIISRATGINDNTIWFVYPGLTGELWLGLNNGIARLNYPAAFTLFDAHFGLDGTLSSVNENQGKMYVSSANGVYYADKTHDQDYKSTFKNVEGISSESWEIADLWDYQLVATTSGVYKLSNTKAEQIKTSWRFAYSFCPSKVDKNLIYVGLHDGLAILQFVNGNWIDGGRIPGISEIIFHIIEENDGTIWLSTLNKGLIRIVPDKNNRNSSYSISRFGKEKGISDKGIILVKHADKIVFGSSNGFMIYNKDENSFEYTNIFGNHFTNGYRIEDAEFDIKDNLWVMGGRDRNFEVSKVTFTKDRNPKLEIFPILNIILENDFYFVPYRIYPDKNSSDILWITASDKLYRFDVKSFNQSLEKINYNTLIREVKTGNDSIIYYGGFRDSFYDNETEWKLTTGMNSIEFSYSVSSYINESTNRFQYYLEGFEDAWSEWTKEFRKEYTNLPSGNLIFHVRASNALDEISQEASFSFYIPTPWYKSNWAVFIYIVMLLTAIWWFVNFRLKFLEKKTVELESMVNERTRLVWEQKETLEEQAKKLVELDRLKTNFFTNISHEFRTPLTLVMGQIENILDSTSEEKVRTKLQMALSNSKRLHSLINQLLELSRLEAGEIRLKVTKVELMSFLKKVFSAFESYAERKNIKLEFTSDHDSLYLYFDREKLEEIFNNLISNAIKFTPDAGLISLKVKEIENQNTIEITIEDTGVGINQESLPNIFDRFYQVDSSQTREFEGTGIGLAIVKELVDLHEGKIKVESTIGKGTSFIIYLKLGSEHLINKSFVEIVDEKDTGKSEEHSRESINIDDKSQNEENEDIGIKDKDIVLIVEDNTEMRLYIQEQLSENFSVVLAKNGEEGIKKAFDYVPDLILTDVMMPILNGYDLTEKIKNDRRTSHIPVIMLTAKADEESKLKGLDLGVDDYLIKPFSKKELYARVGNLIKLRSLLKERYKEISAISLDKIEAKPIDQEFLEKVFNSIKAHLEDPQFGVTLLAREIGMSVSQLNRKLNGLINQSAGKLIRSTKLDYSAQLLKTGAGNISEIAYRVGFSDTPSFSHSFKEKFGHPPSEHLKS